MKEKHTRANVQRSLTRFWDETGSYWMLDNAAIIMPAVSNRRNTFVFRMSASLDHPIVYSAMEEALHACAKRFPYFMVHLKRGFFWYYLQPTSALPVLETDIGPPNMGLNLRQRYRFLFRVRLSGNRVACEFAHILSDGTGCMAFLKALLAEYFRILGVASTPLPGDVRVGDTPSAEEHEDAYHRYYRPGVPPPGKQSQAYHIDSKLLPKGQYRVTCGVVSVEGLSAQAKSRGVSINDLVVAAYMDALITTRQAELDAGKKPRPVVSLEVPVNLRKFYPTKTLRNFSLFALPAIDLRPGGFSFDELVKRVHHLMRLEGDERRMATHVSRNARAGRSIMIRLVPVWLKDFFARLFFESMGEGMMSGMLSNLGPVSMPQELEAHIERFDFVGAPSTIIKTGASMLSWKGMAYISFHSLAQSRDVERLFFSRLAWLGLDVRVESSMEV